MTTKRFGRIAGLMSLVLAGGLLAGCLEEEQGRVLQFEKGAYAGPADTPLSDGRLGDLRQRAGNQAF